MYVCQINTFDTLNLHNYVSIISQARKINKLQMSLTPYLSLAPPKADSETKILNASILLERWPQRLEEEVGEMTQGRRGSQ